MPPKPVANVLCLYPEPSGSDRSLSVNILIALLEQIVCIPVRLCSSSCLTGLSNGQATTSYLRHHHRFLACHSGAALDQAATRQIQQPKTITKLSVFARSTPLQIRLPALQRCRLNTTYTPFEIERAMERALLPTIG